MTAELDSLSNARLVEQAARAAVAHMQEALKALREAQLAIEVGESDAEVKVTDFTNLEGLLNIGIMSGVQTASQWARYANYRPRPTV